MRSSFVKHGLSFLFANAYVHLKNLRFPAGCLDNDEQSTLHDLAWKEKPVNNGPPKAKQFYTDRDRKSRTKFDKIIT
jgi:hypothetical protein